MSAKVFPRQSERLSSAPHHVVEFEFHGPQSEGPIASSIANMIPRQPNRIFHIKDLESTLRFEMVNWVLRPLEPSSRADFWLHRIESFLLQPIASEFFAGESEPSTVQIEHSRFRIVTIPLVRLNPRLR